MQRDTDFTLGEISKQRQSEPAYDKRLGPYDLEIQKAPSGAPENLRFIVVPEIESVDELRSGFTCSLTTKGEHLGMKDYIAVSYCWDSFVAFNATDSKVIVKDGDHDRPLRCPFEVLYRAIRHALWIEAKFLWIDQECIDQTNPVDVQEHLRCMHLIFEQAEHSIGLLSHQITNWTQCTALWIPLSADSMFADAISGHRLDTRLVDINKIKLLTRLLRSISRDRWFSRAWVYQERISAQISMTLLLPLPSAFEPAMTFLGCWRNDFELNCTNLTRGVAYWSIHLQEALSLGLITTQVFEETEIALRCLFQSVRLVSWGFGDYDFEQAIRIIQGEIPGIIARGERSSRGFLVCSMFQNLERCDGRIISDRIAILANAARFDYRMDTTDLSSYSMSLLALLAYNDMLPVILVRTQFKEGFEGFFYPATIARVLNEIHNYQTSYDNLDKGEYVKQQLLEQSNALTQILEPYLPDGVSIESILSIEKAGQLQNHEALVQLLYQELEDITAVMFMSGSATISDVFEGITFFPNKTSAEVNSTLGRQIVQFGIQIGQVPPSAEFLAFAGDWRWQRSFIEEHFIEGEKEFNKIKYII